MNLPSLFDLDLKAIAERPLEPMTVAVVDSGVDATHPVLANRVSEAWSIESKGGEQMIVPRKVPENGDVYGHGTAVAGIVGQVAPNAKILDIRISDGNNRSTGEALLAGFRLAVDQRARVINLSLACSAKFSVELHQLCETADRNNQVVVAAKRNMPLVDNGFPAEFSSCISVDCGLFASPFEIAYRFTPPIEFVAWGQEVRALAPGGGYTVHTGTSFATPMVSGLCALLAGIDPTIRPFEIKSILKFLAKQIDRKS
jgi:subtilisin